MLYPVFWIEPARTRWYYSIKAIITLIRISRLHVYVEVAKYSQPFEPAEELCTTQNTGLKGKFIHH